MRRRGLRSRLTLLVTVAVALAIAISAGACWFLVRDELYDQVDRTFEPPKTHSEQLRQFGGLEHACKPEPQPLKPYGPRSITQAIYTDLPPCYLGPAIKITKADLHVAAHGGRQWRNGVTADGQPVRIMIDGIRPGAAVMDARPIGEVETSLRTLALLLSGVAAVGVLGAATAGLFVSRTALRPVTRLTGAVEHIARTEDLNTSIPVEGTDEIARLSASFNAMTAALAGSRDRQSRLIADAGHELRTPLTSLRTNIDLLLRSEHTGRAIDPVAKARLLVNLKAQFEELSTLVGDLLQLSRGETDREPHVELAFHDVVEAAVQRAKLRGAEVAARLDPWYVEGNPASLERAVLNLLDNAAKFSPGQVEVVLRDGELTVRDHGPGIPEDELPHVFDRFWRSPAARGLPGSGLGLAIVAQAVTEAGGEITLDNARGGGAIAHLRLPGKARPSP